MPGSLAQRAGMAPGDIIRKVGDKEISTAKELESHISAAALTKGLRLVVVGSRGWAEVYIPA